MATMRNLRTALSATAIAAALAACGTLDTRPPSAMEDARLAVDAARGSPQVASLAPAELNDAVAAYDRAYAAWRNQGDTVETRHLAYLALQRAAIAQQAASLRDAERTITTASAERERVRLEARTQEAERATRNAQLAELRADVTRRQALDAQQQAALAEQQARAARTEAAASQLQAAANQQQALDAEARAAQLADELRILQARPTDRGMVITLGDVLFDPGQALLRPGALRVIDRLAAFMREYPMRTVAIEGFTDSTGGYALNRDLSERRAEAVRRALMADGIDGSRIAVRGYGDAYPVASNDSPVGRQQNRRVEILISNEAGVIVPRVASYQPRY